MWEIEGVGTVELVHVGRLLRMGCDSLLMLVYVSDGGGEPLWEQNGLSWEHSVGKAETEAVPFQKPVSNH